MQRPSSNKNANPKGIGSPPKVANRALIPPNPLLCLGYPHKCGLGHILRGDGYRVAVRLWTRAENKVTPAARLVPFAGTIRALRDATPVTFGLKLHVAESD